MTETAPEQFNPADHTVDEVVAYLATADDAERQRVLDAEADGKNRKGITGADLDEAEEEAYRAVLIDAGATERPEPGTELPDQGDGYRRVVVSS